MSTLKVRNNVIADIIVPATNIRFLDGTSQTTAFAPSYGSFESTETQPSSGVSAGKVITMNTQTINNKGVTLVDTSKITYANSGSYFISCIAQLQFNGGASSFTVVMWYKINGGTSTDVQSLNLTSSQSNRISLQVQDIVTLNAGDYIEFYWYYNNASTTVIQISPTPSNGLIYPAGNSVQFNTYKIS
jgi:hypothetical protein